MPQRCKACHSEHRALIDVMLARGVDCKTVAKKFKLPYDSVLRHKNSNHVPKSVTEAYFKSIVIGGELENLAEIELGEAKAVLPTLRIVREFLIELIGLARQEKQYGIAAQIAGQIRETLKFSAQLRGEFQKLESREVVHRLILQDPAYLRLRDGLLEIARNHPAVRVELLNLLREVDGAPSHLDGLYKMRQLEAHGVVVTGDGRLDG